MDYINSLLDFMSKCGVNHVKFSPRLDNTNERFAVVGDSGSKKSGWLIGSVTNDVVTCTFGDWKTGEKHYFCSKQRSELTEEAWAQIEQERQQQAQALEREKEQKAAQASEEAANWLSEGGEAAGHAYLLKKVIKALGGVVQNGGWLDVPVFIDGKLSTLQRIGLDGEKRFLVGGKKSGGYLLLGTQSNSALSEEEAAGELLICEGYATGCSVHEALQRPVCVAFDCGNLQKTGEYFRSLYPSLSIVFAADNDHETQKKSGKNPGLEAAQKSAEAVGGVVCCPNFAKVEGGGAGCSDFNDLALVIGMAEVKGQIEAALSQFTAQNFYQNTRGTNLIKQKNSENEAWGELLPLPDGLRPVEPFNFDLLPFSLRDWVQDIANRMQCPPDFVAVGAMVALSSVIGRKAVILPKLQDNWEVVPNLWGMVVGRPGVMKSPALSATLRPLFELQRKATEDYTQAKKDLGINSKMAALMQKDIESRAQKLVKSGDSEGARALLTQQQAAEEGAGLKARRYIANDASVEALGEILADNPSGLLAYRDELHGLLTSLDKPGQEGSRAFYLQGYDGNQPYTFDRILRGLNLHIPSVCLSMLGGIQPGKLRAYVADALSGGAGDDGLLQRFGLMVWPDIPNEWHDIDEKPNLAAIEAAKSVFSRLDALPIPSEEQPPITYRFALDALPLFKEWRSELENELRTGGNHPALESHLSKYRKLMPAIALVIGMAEGEEGEISRASAIRAILWIKYLRSHAERVYAAGANVQYDSAKLLLDKIKSGKIKGEKFKAADVYLKGWAGLGTPTIVNNACALLCEFGYLRKVVIEQDGRGRPNENYVIHPDLVKA